MTTPAPQGLALVTGAGGFLGRRIVERLLAEGRPVAVLVRSPAPDLEARGVRVSQGDLLDPSAVRAACVGAESIFHVAARVGIWGPEEEFRKVNVEGTELLLETSRGLGARRFIYTSTPSVVFNGRDIVGGDESMPYGRDFPAAYPATKAIAEKLVLAAHRPTGLRTVALRPHLIWGAGDRHLIPPVVPRAKAGRLRIVGTGENRVDLTHVKNVVHAHLLAEAALAGPECRPGGRAYFITNDEPVLLWSWINELLVQLEIPPVRRRISLSSAKAIGAVCEALWSTLKLKGEPPMTRFVAAELAKDHWFDVSAARRDLGYEPIVSMADGLREIVAELKRS